MPNPCTDCGDNKSDCGGACSLQWDGAVSSCMSQLGIQEKQSLCSVISQIASGLCATNLLLIHPVTEVVWGNKPDPDSSSPNLTYDNRTARNEFKMLDPNTGNTIFLFDTDDGSGSAQFTLTADNFNTTGNFAQINGDTSGNVQIESYSGSQQKVFVELVTSDIGTKLHGLLIAIDTREKARFQADSLDLRPINNEDYEIRYYDRGAGGGTKYFATGADSSISANRKLVWPDNDPVAGQSLKVVSFIGGVIKTQWA